MESTSWSFGRAAPRYIPHQRSPEPVCHGSQRFNDIEFSSCLFPQHGRRIFYCFHEPPKIVSLTSSASTSYLLGRFSGGFLIGFVLAIARSSAKKEPRGRGLPFFFSKHHGLVIKFPSRTFRSGLWITSLASDGLLRPLRWAGLEAGFPFTRTRYGTMGWWLQRNNETWETVCLCM
jgi:hypothetical protein